jgi:DNA mismatch repair protein MutL
VIRLLDETTVGQIAAGEVVERPLSVVKELVENALDAGATRISIAVTHGGLESIDVSDDGAGIVREELPLAFARHATSKLTVASDLERVRTLGFRGEGLASIAAVARVRATSRTSSSDVGFAVDAFGLDISEAQPIAAAPGTRIVVRDLFANVPARREYLRAPAAEFARISSFVATLALGYPEVAFSLAHDGRPTFVFPAQGAAQRLAHVFGPEPARALIPIARDGHPEPLPAVRGFVSTPGVDRADRRMQLLFVNGRLLRSTLLAGAWTAAYSTFALVGRQPFGVIFLEVAAEDVDPNVHPTKSDVRLRRPELVHDAVRRAIARTLAADAGERMRATMSFAPPGAGNSAPAYRAAPFEWNTRGNDAANGNGNGNGHAHSAIGTPPEPALRVLAQLDSTYILATDGTALVLVDQHAAHERIAFETIARRALAGKPVGEPLLIPYTVELDAADVSRFESSRAALVAAGLEAEPFGERAYRVVATPAGYGARAFDIRSYVESLGDEVPGLGPRERVWASLACHSVVRAGDALEVAEMSALLERLIRCENPMHCPHGRPTMVRIEADAVAKMFKRT